MLDFYGIPLKKKHALIIGRSGVVGKPFAQLLLARDATVTIAHSQTQNLPALIAQADIIATAVGKPGIVRADMLKPCASVIDFGAAMVDGVMTGDANHIDFLGRAYAITPVPGGTGPVTNAMLLRNAISAIKRSMHAA
jgi:methylenetetrahydrofolate dehydrogenase (NADP+)/methenyltetrahydrofolate cyclohydrolase